MPTAVVTGHTTPVALFTVPSHLVGRLTALDLSNESGAARVIRIRDDFPTDASVDASTGASASAASNEIDRFRIQVAENTTEIVPKNELENIRCLGTIKAIADSVSSDVHILAQYHYE